MQIGQNATADKPSRNRLPNRRYVINISFERDGARFEMTIGHYPDGRLGEIFLKFSVGYNHDGRRTKYLLCRGAACGPKQP